MKKKKEILIAEKTPAKTKNIFINQISGYPDIIIILLALLCFGKIIFFGFLNYDDTLFIIDNKKILGDFSNIPAVFQHGIWSLVNFAAPTDYYRPFLILSFMLDAQLGGTSALVYHTSNIFYHLIACLLLYRLLQKLDIKKETALLLTLLFTVHPVLVQAVAWIPGRNDILLAIFVFASFLHFVNYSQSGKMKSLILHFLFFFFALMTKETAVLLPVICFLYSIFFSENKFPVKKNFISAAIWIVLIMVYFYIREKAIGKTEQGVTAELLIQTVLYRIPAIIQYLGKIIFPFNLSVKPTQEDTSYIPGILAFVVLTVSIFLSEKKNYKQIIFGAAWFILFLLPVLSLPKNFNDNLFEHRVYVPLAGILILINQSFLFKNNLLTGNKGVVSGVAIIVLFSFISIAHTTNFKTAVIFWKNAASNSPGDPEAQFNLAGQYFTINDKENAQAYFLKALKLKPGYKRANAGLAVVYAQKGEMEMAEKYYKIEIATGTKDIQDFKGLGGVLLSLKKPLEAITCFEKASELDSTDMQNNEQLGFLYFEQQNYPAAKKTWERMLILNPAHPNANKNLAILYSRTGEYDKAISYALLEEKHGGQMPEGFVQEMTKRLKMGK